MADEKAKIVTDATGPGSGPAPAQPEVDAQVSKQEQSAPEAPTPDKAEAPAQEAPAQDKAADAPKEQKAASVSVFNFSEIMAEKKATERAAAQQEAKAPDKGTSPTPTKEDGPKQEKSKEQEQAPKRRGRPPKADKYKAAAPAQKEAPSKKDKAVQKSAQPGKTEKAAPSEKTEKAPKAPSPAKGAPEVKAPVQAETPAAPAEAPRPGKEEQIVYIKLSELHAFKNHPFQVRNDEEMKAMVSSVRDKGVTQPAIVRPREDGGYEIVSGHRRQKASELAGFVDMPCIVRDLTDEQAITQMVEDNTNQRENILPSERAKALKMQLEAIKHQGAKEATSGQLDPKDAGRRSNEIVAERNKMTVKQAQRYIKLNDLVPDLQKMMDAGQIKFTPAVELAYIKPKNQRYIAVAIEGQQSAPSLSQAQRMRELDQKGVLNGDVIDGIMMEDKKEVDKVILTGAELGKYFGKETTPREMKDQINQNSFNDGITGEALGGASYESAPIISNSYYFSFADDNSQYILTVYGEASQIAELRQSFVSVLPILFCVILLVSLATAWVYSRIITNPVLKISRISKEMSDMRLEWQLEERRSDELGVLENSLNTLSRKLSATLEELQSANLQLQKDIEHQKALERAQQDFFSSASHELKTPITIIKGQLEGMLLGIGAYKDHEKYLARSLEVAATLETMVQEILTISRLETNVDFKMEHFDCAPMIHGYLREIDDLVATKELQIHLAIQSPAFINGNKLLIEKVFSNLISNAVKYSPHGASVDIILQNTNGRFLFSVENTGTHIPEDDIPKLFDAFYRMEQSRSRRTGGSGLNKPSICRTTAKEKKPS